MANQYTTIQGHEFEITDNPPGTLAFLERVKDSARAGATEDQLVELIYSDANPTLGPYPFGGRGAVTRDTLDNPAYWAMGDLLFRARLAARGVSADHASARYTLTVTEASKRLGVSRAAVTKAVATRRLESWVRDGQSFLCPDDVDRWAASLQESRRGPAPEQPAAVGGPLEVSIGNKPGVFFKLRAPSYLEAFESGHHGKGYVHAGWKLIAVSYSGKSEATGETVRTFLLIGPSAGMRAIECHGYYLRGCFKILKKLTGESAGKAWKEFKPEP
jgi:excisionase family DNA binding protein